MFSVCENQMKKLQSTFINISVLLKDVLVYDANNSLQTLFIVLYAPGKYAIIFSVFVFVNVMGIGVI